MKLLDFYKVSQLKKVVKRSLKYRGNKRELFVKSVKTQRIIGKRKENNGNVRNVVIVQL